MIRQMLDGQTQTARAGGADHEPGTARGEVVVADFAAEFFVVGLVVIPANALLGHACGATGFENIERFAFKSGRHPDFGLQIAQPFVLKMGELQQIGRGMNLGAGIEVFGSPFQPEGSAGFRGKMPGDNVAQMGVELDLGFFGSGHE